MRPTHVADELFPNGASTIRLVEGVIETQFSGLVAHLPEVLASPEGCFAFLKEFPYKQGSYRLLHDLRSRFVEAGLSGPYAAEHYLILQASIVALSSIKDLTIDEGLKRQFWAICSGLAETGATDIRLDGDCDAFAELAKIMTLQRFHAGQLSFDVTRIPRTWFLKIHPKALPRIMLMILRRFGGLGPVVMPHLNYWRQNPIFMFPRAQEKALHLTAKCIAQDKKIKGLVASSWLYSPDVSAHCPHLSWLRDFYLQHGASVCDLGPALGSAGFLIGSAHRRKLYENGTFRPRETLILWPRAELLAWASAQENINRFCTDSYSPLEDAPAGWNRTTEAGHAILRPLKSARRREWWRKFLFYRPKQYILFTLLLPAILSAIVAAFLGSVTLSFLVLVAVLCGLWLLQYFVLYW